MTNELFPDLDAEQAWLEHARRCRASMLARLRPLLGSTVGADDFTDEFVHYIAQMQVDDLDASLAKAFARGGVLALDKMVIPGVGTVAYVLDSEANVIGMLQPEA